MEHVFFIRFCEHKGSRRGPSGRGCSAAADDVTFQQIERPSSEESTARDPHSALCCTRTYQRGPVSCSASHVRIRRGMPHLRRNGPSQSSVGRVPITFTGLKRKIQNILTSFKTNKPLEKCLQPGGRPKKGKRLTR